MARSGLSAARWARSMAALAAAAALAALLAALAASAGGRAVCETPAKGQAHAASGSQTRTQRWHAPKSTPLSPDRARHRAEARGRRDVGVACAAPGKGPRF